MIPPLSVDPDLANYWGGPYPDAVVRAAEASIRAQTNWHITPEYRETVDVEAKHREHLTLPTQRIVEVHSVTDQNGNVVEGFTTKQYKLIGTWKTGELYTVDFTHGWESADELLPIVAHRCQHGMAAITVTQRSETVGSRTFSESYNHSLQGDALYEAIITRYTIKREWA